VVFVKETEQRRKKREPLTELKVCAIIKKDPSPAENKRRKSVIPIQKNAEKR